MRNQKLALLPEDLEVTSFITTLDTASAEGTVVAFSETIILGEFTEEVVAPAEKELEDHEESDEQE